jgi:hypothetical protein
MLRLSSAMGVSDTHLGTPTGRGLVGVKEKIG